MAPGNAIARLLSFLVCCCVIEVFAAQDTSSCNLGTLEDDCLSAGDGNEFFFCTDRYSWEWSQDVHQLPKQASDALCLTMDSNVIPDLLQTELVVLGGCDAESQEIFGTCQSLSGSTRTYDPVLDRFDERQGMPTERFRAAAVNVSEYIYLFGGRDGNETLTCNVDRYNVITGVWEELDAVQDNNCYSDHSGVASDDGTIYLFGGYSEDYQAQNTVVKVEVSDGDQLSFSTSSPMETRRGDHSCVRLPASSEVFCIGGFTETEFDFSILKSVERFDIETEEWETKAAMVNPRADFGAGLLNDRITVVGGEDDAGRPMDDVEWYDPEGDCWTDSGELFDLPYKRLRYCAATVPSVNRIFIFGGQAVDETSDEIYSIERTVNWYQEVLVDQLTPSAAAPGPHTAASTGLAAAIALTSALVLAFHSE